MSERLFSDHWYRVAQLRPRLRAHVRVHRHDYRGEIWYVLFDPLTQRSHRFSEAANFLVARMDGRASVDEIWRAACDRLGDEAPTQDEFIRLLSQLHGSDLLVADVVADAQEIERRQRRQSRAEIKQRFWSPLSLKIPLLDPDDFVTRTMGYVAPLFGWGGFVLWLVVVGAGLSLAAVHWSELTENVADRVLTGSNILIAGLIYPVVKAIHELGHAYAIKRWGGDVPEMGIMLIVFMPVPYVDATSAIAMRRKRRRIVVSAMGVMAELFMAALALIVWVWVEPGLTRAVAYNVVLICSVSTLLFNGNPLLRFDAYYVLADLIEVPNLGTRANKYLGYLVQRYLFRMENAESPVTARGERGWFVFYGIAAFFYRMFIMFSIVLFVATRFFFVGAMLAIWAVFTQILVPVGKLGKFVATDQRLGRQRPLALRVTALGIVALALVLLFLPVPYATMAHGVVRPPDEAIVRAGTAGRTVEIAAGSSAHVVPGQPILRTEDPLLRSRLEVLRTKLDEYRARLDMILAEDPRRAEVVREQIRATEADLADIEARVGRLMIRSPGDGILVLPEERSLIGRHLGQGDVVAYVLDADELRARVAVPEGRIGLVRDRQVGVAVWPADVAQGGPVPARLDRVVPGGTRRLSSSALGSQGGGEIAVDPAQPDGTHALRQVFELDVSFANPEDDLKVGRRVYVRFDHGTEPIAGQVWHGIRQLFLDRFEL